MTSAARGAVASRAGTHGPPLVAVAHGSRDPRAARTVAALLAEVRRRRPGLDVRASFLDHVAPDPATVLDGLARTGAGEAVVLPLLLTAAYHSRVDLPAVLQGVRAAHPEFRLRTGDTLGPHPALYGALTRRLAEAGVRPCRDTAVVLVAAGSGDPAANAVIGLMAAEWAASGRWRNVVAAYASAAAPTPDEAVAALLRAGAPRVVVASYLLAPGRFADLVARRTLAAGAVAVSPVLGAAPELASIVLQRYDEALHRRRAQVPAGSSPDHRVYASA